MPFALGLLAVVLALLNGRLQGSARRLLVRSRAAVFVVPIALTVVFATAAAYYEAFSFAVVALVAGYTFVPTIVVFVAGVPPLGEHGTAKWLDFVAILFLWLPLEFAVGASLIPREVQGALHAVAYGIAITLGVTLFLLYRCLDGMKYNLPRRAGDFRNALVGYAMCFAVLIPLGLWIGFLDPFHSPRMGIEKAVLRVATILFATALPEEILFRALIQNWILQRFGSSNWSVLLAAVIFGVSHLNNGPGPLPNWRYGIVATIAGFVFGKVFQKSSSIFASALVHTGVDATKHFWF